MGYWKCDIDSMTYIATNDEQLKGWIVDAIANRANENDVADYINEKYSAWQIVTLPYERKSVEECFKEYATDIFEKKYVCPPEGQDFENDVMPFVWCEGNPDDL